MSHSLDLSTYVVQSYRFSDNKRKGEEDDSDAQYGVVFPENYLPHTKRQGREADICVDTLEPAKSHHPRRMNTDALES